MHDGTVLGSEAWFLWARQKADLQGLPLAFLQLWWGGGASRWRMALPLSQFSIITPLNNYVYLPLHNLKTEETGPSVKRHPPVAQNTLQFMHQ